MFDMYATDINVWYNKSPAIFHPFIRLKTIKHLVIGKAMIMQIHTIQTKYDTIIRIPNTETDIVEFDTSL